MNLITCKALAFFLVLVPDFGQIHGDPNSDDEATRFPKIPDHAIPKMVAAGQIEAPEWLNAEPEVEKELEPRAVADGETLAAAPLFTVTHVSGPNFDVFGPGMDAPERVKGKAAAEELAARLEADYYLAQPINAPTPEGEDDGETATEDAAPL